MKTSRSSADPTGALTATLGAFVILAASAIAFASGAAASTIMPHRAFYEMQLGIADQNSNVQTVSGRSAFTLGRECDGWRSSEDYVIEFGAQGGNLDRVVSHFESWESDTGKIYSFEISESSSFQSAKDFTGFAELKSAGGNAYFSMADDAAVELPENTYFPMRHLTSILDSAKTGKKILAASVFTGAEPDDALLSTNTVIGSWRGDPAAAEMGALGQDGYWPVQIAYFKPAATAAEPEYEIHFAIQPNGIVRRYVIDYGDFTIIAMLLKLESVEMPACS